LHLFIYYFNREVTKLLYIARKAILEIKNRIYVTKSYCDFMKYRKQEYCKMILKRMKNVLNCIYL